MMVEAFKKVSMSSSSGEPALCGAGQIPAPPDTPTAGGEETFLSLP